MQHFLSAVQSSRRIPPPPRASRLIVLLLLLVLGAAALPAVQAQGINMYVFVYNQKSSNIPGRYHYHAHFAVGRVSLGAGYDEQRFRLCVSGNATPDADYYLRSNSISRFSLNNGCVTDYWARGQQTESYYVVVIGDHIDESNETVTVTLSQDSGDRFPSGYYFASRKVNFRIMDDD